LHSGIRPINRPYLQYMAIVQILEITSMICTALILPIWHFFQPPSG
jgi:hypothetical protein